MAQAEEVRRTLAKESETKRLENFVSDSLRNYDQTDQRRQLRDVWHESGDGDFWSGYGVGRKPH